MNEILRGRLEPAEQAIAELAAAFGNRLATSRAVREQHGNTTTTWLACEPPDAVLFPQSADDVQRAVRICACHRAPIIPFGAGTSFDGHVNAPLGGVSLDFKDMNRVLAVHAEDFDCVVEPGVTRKQLNEQLRDQGLFFPVDPGADASLGGMASTRASGTTAVRYGTMKDNVPAVKALLANGELISTSRRARKSSAGYDLARLIVGAEGTLGVIKLKRGGEQTVRVEHVHVYPGGQAIVGAVSNRKVEGGGGDENENQAYGTIDPRTIAAAPSAALLGPNPVGDAVSETRGERQEALPSPRRC